jgi:hypothetical protein
MYLGGIWIKAGAEILLAIIALLCGIYAYKKLNWKTVELSATVLICLIMFVFGLTNVSRAVNPDIQQATVNFVYQSQNGVMFGREYHFIDENDNDYDLTMDPITSGKLLGDNDFDDNTIYTITYEAKSKTIVGIDADDTN